MAKYTTRDGDMLDAIVYRYYGNIAGVLEAVYSINPGLCEKPLLLPAGLMIELPVLEEPGEKAEIDLFG